MDAEKRQSTATQIAPYSSSALPVSAYPPSPRQLSVHQAKARLDRWRAISPDAACESWLHKESICPKRASRRRSCIWHLASQSDTNAAVGGGGFEDDAENGKCRGIALELACWVIMMRSTARTIHHNHEIADRGAVDRWSSLSI